MMDEITIYNKDKDESKGIIIDNIFYVMFSLFFFIFIGIIIYDLFIENLQSKNRWVLIGGLIVLSFGMLSMLKTVKGSIYESYPINIDRARFKFPITWFEQLYKENEIKFNEIDRIEIKYWNNEDVNDMMEISIVSKTNNKYLSGEKSRDSLIKLLTVINEKCKLYEINLKYTNNPKLKILKVKY